MEHWTEYTRFFTALLVILDLFMAVPTFLALTHHYTPAERRRVVNIATLSVALILVVSALSGERLLFLPFAVLASTASRTPLSTVR
jgi:multiple antibiotic resistance protein